MKRKRYSELKNDLCVELHKLTNSSGDLNNDLHAANEDFELMFRSMIDRQKTFLTRCLLLEETYSDAIGVLDGRKKDIVEESSGENVVLPIGYANDVHKFASDARVSLNGHGEFMAEEYDTMKKMLEKYEKLWNENMKDLVNRAELIAKQRSKLSVKLSEFIRIDEED